MRKNRLLFNKGKHNPNRRWYEFWKPFWIYKTYTLKVNKDGEIELDKEYEKPRNSNY